MKQTITLLFFLLCVFSVKTMRAQEGIGTNLPDKSAALDIVSSQRGLLIPRIDIPDLLQSNPVVNPAQSLLVYNLGAGGTTPQGFYYWDNSANSGSGAWLALTAGNPSGTPTTVTAGENIAVSLDNSGGFPNYTIGIEPGTDGQVLITEENPTGQFHTLWVDPASFMSSGLTADNGLTIDQSTVKLGGVLTEPTIITTAGNSGANTLAIAGLEAAQTDNALVVAETDPTTEGVLRTVQRTLSVNANSNLQIGSTAISNYSPYTPFLHIYTDVSDLSTADVEITLPDPQLAEGQVITVKLTDTQNSGDADHYLTIYQFNQTEVLTYGALPYQGWVIKSNGNTWHITGRY